MRWTGESAEAIHKASYDRTRWRVITKTASQAPTFETDKRSVALIIIKTLRDNHALYTLFFNSMSLMISITTFSSEMSTVSRRQMDSTSGRGLSTGVLRLPTRLSEYITDSQRPSESSLRKWK